jgi:hypothetical protein
MKRRPPTATLPCVDAIERHELMLLRMGGNTKSLLIERIGALKKVLIFTKNFL